MCNMPGAGELCYETDIINLQVECYHYRDCERSQRPSSSALGTPMNRRADLSVPQHTGRDGGEREKE